jgi:chitodextrinase
MLPTHGPILRTVVACLAGLLLASTATAVEPPRDVRAEPSGETRIWIRWLAPVDGAGVAGYEVLRGPEVVTRTFELSFTDAGLAPFTGYCYSVRALDRDGRASRTTGPACTRTPDLTAPTTPASPVVTMASAGVAEVTWGASTDNVEVERYELLREGRVVARAAATRALEEGLAPGSAPCYAVRAVDAAGNRSPPSRTACAAAPDTTPPGTPHAAAEVGDGFVVLAWTVPGDDVGVAGYEVLREDQVVARVDGTSQVLRGLPAGRHCLQVRALDAAGNRSPPSAAACADVPDTTPPEVPSGLAVAERGEHALSLRWEAARDDVGVVAYELVRDGRVVAGGAATEAGERELRSVGEHCYQVRALDAAGNRSGLSEPLCATTLDVTPPTVPALQAVRPESDRAVRVEWSPASDEIGVAGYEVLRDDRVVVTATGVEATEAGLRAAGEYCYRVRAFDAAGNRSEPSAAACTRTPDLLPPSVPDQVLATAASPSRVTVTWRAAIDDVGVVAYEVFRDGVRVGASTAPTFAESHLRASTQHCYRIQARDAAGNRSEPSEASCTTTAPPGFPTAPARVWVQPVDGRSLLLRWEPSPEPGVVYAIYWGEGHRIGATRYEGYKVEGVKAGENRCFQVASVSPSGAQSPLTRPVCAAASETASISTR